MSVTVKRQLPNLNNEKIRQLNSLNTENNIQHAQQNYVTFKQTTSLADKFRNNGNRRNKDVRFDNNSGGHSTFSNEYRKNKKIITPKEQLNNRDTNDSIISSKQDSILEEVVHPRFDRRLQEIKRNHEEQQRKLPTSIFNEEDQILQARTKSQLQNPNRHLEENEMNKSFLTQQNSTTIRECAKSIRENVTQFKNQLMRNEIERKKQIPKDEELVSLLNRRRRSEKDHRQLENEYLIEQQTILSKSATLNEMLSFKKELEKSERQREQLADHLESLSKTCDEKDKVVSKTLFQLKEIAENCDTLERQSTKLQHDLTLALEKLEEMTDEAERFAQESFNSQKQLADSEQKREEFQIQTQETNKQWNARIKKLEKDIDRYKLDSTQMLEKNEQLIKENENFKSRNSTLKEQITKVETDLNESNINYNRLEEQFKQSENNNIQLRTIHSSQQAEITTLKKTVNELENQLSIQRQRFLQTDTEKQNLQGSLQEEIKHRNYLHSKLKQSEQDIESINKSYSELQNERMDLLQRLKEIQIEKDFLLKEKTKFLSIENDNEGIKRKLETTKIDYTRGMKALQMDYENKIETFQLQLSDEKSQLTILQRHEIEYKKEIERFQEKLSKYEDENTQGQYTIETLSREIDNKIQLINELESKITKLTNEITNQRNETLKKDKDYQNSLHTIYNDIIHCTECLSNDSNKPFLIEPATIPHDHIEVWSSKLKAHLAWVKQELEIYKEQENKLREDLNNALIDCETDRKYFSSELSKREILINELTNFRREYSIDKQRLSTEDQRNPIDHRYEQFQIMIDSVKRELHTAKAELLS